jgi:hypothetical protein
MSIDTVLNKLEEIIDGTHSAKQARPLKMGHCKYCTTWLTLVEEME